MIDGIGPFFKANQLETRYGVRLANNKAEFHNDMIGFVQYDVDKVEFLSTEEVETWYAQVKDDRLKLLGGDYTLFKYYCFFTMSTS